MKGEAPTAEGVTVESLIARLDVRHYSAVSMDDATQSGDARCPFPSRAQTLEALGETLLHAQEFERSIGEAIGLVFSDRKTIGRDELADIDRDARRITLGRFVERLKRRSEKAGHSSDVHHDLTGALDGRNRMVHRIVDDPEFDLKEVEGRRRLLTFLVNLRMQMAHLNVVFTYYKVAFLEDVGVLSPDIRRQMPDFFELCDELGAVLFRVDGTGETTTL